MTSGAFTHVHGPGFLAYLWHYIVARLIYDDLVRPLTRSAGALALLTLVAVGGAVWVLRRRARSARQ
jgi:hypothetical protein